MFGNKKTWIVNKRKGPTTEDDYDDPDDIPTDPDAVKNKTDATKTFFSSKMETFSGKFTSPTAISKMFSEDPTDIYTPLMLTHYTERDLVVFLSYARYRWDMENEKMNHVKNGTATIDNSQYDEELLFKILPLMQLQKMKNEQDRREVDYLTVFSGPDIAEKKGGEDVKEVFIDFVKNKLKVHKKFDAFEIKDARRLSDGKILVLFKNTGKMTLFKILEKFKEKDEKVRYFWPFIDFLDWPLEFYSNIPLEKGRRYTRKKFKKLRHLLGRLRNIRLWSVPLLYKNTSTFLGNHVVNIKKKEIGRLLLRRELPQQGFTLYEPAMDISREVLEHVSRCIINSRPISLSTVSFPHLQRRRHLQHRPHLQRRWHLQL